MSEGHNYSVLAAFPETAADEWSRWAVPISVERVGSLSNAIEVAHHQIAQLLSYRQTAPRPLQVLTVDSRYPTPAFLQGLRDYPALLVIARVRRNRSFYQQPEPDCSSTRPYWYGPQFKLNDADTWPPPEQQETISRLHPCGARLLIASNLVSLIAVPGELTSRKRSAYDAGFLLGFV